MNIITCFIAIYLLALHSRNRSTLAGTSKHMRIYTRGVIPRGVTHTLGRNDRGVIHSSDNVTTNGSGLKNVIEVRLWRFLARRYDNITCVDYGISINSSKKHSGCGLHDNGHAHHSIFAARGNWHSTVHARDVVVPPLVSSCYLIATLSLSLLRSLSFFCSLSHR